MHVHRQVTEPLCMMATETSLPLTAVSEARQDFAELVNRAAYGDERIRIVRRGRENAAIGATSTGE